MSSKKVMKFYEGAEKVLFAVDSIIFGFDNSELKLLLMKRPVEPLSGMWSLIGGFVSQEESLDEAASRVLEWCTGLKDIYMEQLYTFGDPHRDTGARTVSTAYYALIKIEDYDSDLMEQYDAKWFPITHIPDLVFDHNKMVNRALIRLRRKAQSRPIGFELLPKKFTLPQLQSLYEAIYQKPLDKRNFRKKMLSSGLLIKLEEKERSGSKKGAFLYQFDQKKYEQDIKEGLSSFGLLIT